MWSRISRALGTFRRVQDSHAPPDHKLVELGRVHESRHEFAAAELAYRSALDAFPRDPVLHFLLGNALIAQGRGTDAINAYERALALREDFAEAANNLGNVLRSLGQPAAAAARYEQAVRLLPGFAEAHFNLGLVYQELGRYEHAVTAYERAAALQPDSIDAQFCLGYLYANEDRRPEALQCFRSALTLNPDHVQARWNVALAQLLAVCGPDDDPERGRAAFERELDGLAAWLSVSRVASAHIAVGGIQPFRLAYHELNNKDLLARHGSLCTRVMSHWQANHSIRATSAARTGPIRVALVSRFLRDHSVWRAMLKGWFERLDANRVQLLAYCVGPEHDSQTDIARRCAAHFEHGHATLEAWARAIVGQRPDALIYPEIGMDAMTLRLASMRLAPVQMAAWGHPETTGLPTMDYYLSARDFEPEGAQAAYTETLIELPNLGCYVEPEADEPEVVDPTRWGLGDDAPMLLCPGTPFKYAPEYDWVLAEIAGRLGQCSIVFFTHSMPHLSDRLHLRLDGVFRRRQLRPEDYLRFIPWLEPRGFRGLMKRAHVYLDTIGFSGFNSAMQAVQCALPIVTREGRFMRGRFASAILKRLGLPQLVAPTETDYVDLVVRLVREPEFAQRVRETMAANRDGLFRDTSAVRALETFLHRVSRGEAVQ